MARDTSGECLSLPSRNAGHVEPEMCPVGMEGNCRCPDKLALAGHVVGSKGYVSVDTPNSGEVARFGDYVARWIGIEVSFF
jgi:hypothetical protein